MFFHPFFLDTNMANMPKDNDLTGIYTLSGDFWEGYRKGRPQVPDSFFERIYTYHASHGGQFGTVHDAGGGPGVHSARLANRFEKVILTDVAESNISLAQTQLQGPGFEFHAAKLEDTINLLPAGSVDLVFAATMLHFTDIPKALEAVAHQLKPGGTFAIPCTGLLILQDARAQEIWAKLHRKGLEPFSRKFRETWVPSFQANGTGYDSVLLPEEYFEPGALRMRLNETMRDTPGGLKYEMLISPEIRDKCPPISRIKPDEKVVFEDDEDWRVAKDIADPRQVISTYLFDMKADVMKELWSELENIVGDRVVDGRWVTYLTLATRK